MWWYEVIETVRRLTMTGLLVLFRRPEVRLAMATFLSFLSVLLHFTTEPYLDIITNSLALVSHLLVFAVFFVGQEIAFGVIETENLGVGILLVILLLTPPILMVYFLMTQAQRDRIQELRHRERQVQIEEMFATLDQLKAKEDKHCARDEASYEYKRVRTHHVPTHVHGHTHSLAQTHLDAHTRACSHRSRYG